MAADDSILSHLDRLLEQAKQVEATSHVEHHEDLGPFEVLDADDCTQWLLSCTNMAERVAGKDSPYYRHLLSCQECSAAERTTLDTGRAALRALREDYANGLLVDFRELAAGEVFSDFLDMAEHLCENGYQVPAASLVGAVLEDALRRLHLKHVGEWAGESRISKLNDALHKARIYPQPQWRQIQTWADIRNDADHGNFDNVDRDDVARMVRALRDFLVKYGS